MLASRAASRGWSWGDGEVATVTGTTRPVGGAALPEGGLPGGARGVGDLASRASAQGGSPVGSGAG